MMRPVALSAALAIATGGGLFAQSRPPQVDPDRPDLTNGTHIVDSGLVQLEVGGLYTRDAPGHSAISSPFTVRVGLFKWLEARIGGDGVLTRADTESRATGFGNVQLGAKLRLWADPGGAPLLSLLPAVNIPTADARKGLGTGDADYTLALLTGTDMGRRAHMDVNYAIGRIGGGDGRPRFLQHLLSASASYAATARWNPYAELYWFSRQDADSGSAAAVDAGAIRGITRRLAIDGGLQVGITRSAADFAAFGGFSILVGGEGDGVDARRSGPIERHPAARRSTR
jgi:hypothetical protein